MNYKHCCVVNSAGYYQTNVLVHLEPGKDDNTVERIDTYILKTAESLIDAKAPSNMIHPRWTGIDWEETATEEEIEAAKPEPLPPAPPSDTELLAVEMTAIVAAMQEQNDMAIADLTMLMAAGMGV